VAGNANRPDLRIPPVPLRRRLRESAAAYVYLAPATVILGVFWLWPTVFALYISMSKYDLDGTVTFHGWEGFAWTKNYAAVFGRAYFYRALINTVNFVLYTVPTSLAISLFIAVLLNQRIRLLGFFRTVYFLPYVTSLVAVSVVWVFVFHQTFGLANAMLGWVGLGPFNWLNESRGIWEMLVGWVIRHPHFRIMPELDPADQPLLFMVVGLMRGPSLALTAIIIMTVWRNIGYNMVIFLAGLQGIDKTYYEAADIDGANPWQKFWRITWPLVSPYTFFLAIISTIFAFKEFIGVFIMTPEGGLEYDTATVIYYLFDLAFRGRFDFGRAAAVGFILFLILTVISLIQKRLFGGRVHYD
jgi:multiple sugar transport system permease protein